MRKTCDMNVALNLYMNSDRGRENNIDIFPCKYDIYIVFDAGTSQDEVMEISDEVSDVVHSIVSNRELTDAEVVKRIKDEIDAIVEDPHYDVCEIYCEVIDVFIKERKFDWV